MSLAAGTRLGPYEIGALLGRGGMGEVYRARDTKLDREVAIKILPEEFANNDERLARFEREAKLLASLNHPNIASIYGLEESDGVQALVLELVEGPTLAERIAEGPIPVEEALPLARQIAEALEAGHEAGVIHRDLKPANVKVKEDGTVKVLDYGLAKALEGDTPSGTDSKLSQSPTLTRHGTEVGVILGTAAYMSPEQAKGKRVDERTDIWAFGAVVYEMLTGKRAFAGEDVSDTLAAVLRGEPDFDGLPVTTPGALRRALRLCLTKDVKQRIHAIADVRLMLSGAMDDEPSVDPAGKVRAPLRVVAAIALVSALASGLAVWSVTPERPSRHLARFHQPLPDGVRFSNTSRKVIDFARDGSRIAYSANSLLYVRTLDDPEARVVAVGGSRSIVNPFFSPDGEWVGFYSRGELHKVPVRGGGSVRICKAERVHGVSWEADGTILFGQGEKGIFRVSENGGTPEVLIALAAGDGSAHGPQLLPGGGAVLFTLGQAGETDIVVQRLDTAERRVVLEDAAEARYTTSGHLVYLREATLFAAPFDPDRFEITGSSVPVVEDVADAPNPALFVGQFSVSESGSLVYVPKAVAPTERTLVWLDRDGNEEPLPLEPRHYKKVRIAPDGTRAALVIEDADNDIWVLKLASGTLTRLTFDPGSDNEATWSRDGRHIVFSSDRAGRYGIYSKLADGAGPVEKLFEGERDFFVGGVSRDEEVVYFDADRTNIGMVTAEGVDRILVSPNASVGWPALSPDDRWLAYTSWEKRPGEIFVSPFPGVEAGRWQISQGGGTTARWAPDGRELFYVTRDEPARLMSVRIRTGTSLSYESPVMVTDGPYVLNQGFDMSPDGERFLMVKKADGEDDGWRRYVLVLNWFQELERLAPANN